MVKWKLCRQKYGNCKEEKDLIFSEGDKISFGRGLENTVILPSIVISRNHCLINFKKNEVSITDLQSSNGTYIGLKKLSPNVPFTLSEADIIGLGWTVGAPLAQVKDEEKFIYKLIKCTTPIPDRLKFQDDDIEEKIASLDAIKTSPKNNELSPVIKPRLQLKRKLQLKFEGDEINNALLEPKVEHINEDVVNILSDSDNEPDIIEECAPKKIKFEPDIECVTTIKSHNEDFEYDAFQVKQEYFEYNDEPIEITSDSDSESEHWIRRLSQNSPGKPLRSGKKERLTDSQPEDGSYSQLDDVFEIEDDILELRDGVDDIHYLDDLIIIPPEPPVIDEPCIEQNSNRLPKEIQPLTIEKSNTELKSVCDSDVIIDISQEAIPHYIPNIIETKNNCTKEIDKNLRLIESDVIDGISNNNKLPTDITENVVKPVTSLPQNCTSTNKKAQLIEPLSNITTKKSKSFKKDPSEGKSKSSRSNKTKKESSSSKRKITNSQKEERKKKLKRIADKDRDVEECSKEPSNSANKSVFIVKEKDVEESNKQSANNSAKAVVNVKVTTANRGAFLSDVNQAIVEPTKRKSSPLKEKKKNIEESTKNCTKTSVQSSKSSKDKYVKIISDELERSNEKSKQKAPVVKSKVNQNTFKDVIDSDTRIPFKSLKPLTESKESCLGKPVSKVEPLPPKKPKKSVRFSDAPPTVREFEIEPGNRMKKTSSVKTTLVDVHNKRQIYSLEKIFLITILRWNPHWLAEQKNITEPPPILSHKEQPMAILQSFDSHKDYVRVIGDLLLMEIWECITQAFNRITHQNVELPFRIESCPLEPPAQDRFKLSNMVVNLSLPTSEIKRLPRIGEILTLEFGPENARTSRFVYVNNLKHLPSPSNNINSFYSISLNATYTDKMKGLKPGELIIGRTLACIKNELLLFEAIEYLACSPLCRAILSPEPDLFTRNELNVNINLNSQWTMNLNPSQKLAVSNSVSAALGDRPAIQMVQGPPGTGKSSVICAIVMTYLYDTSGRKQQNTGKILICATSNAAVDELVIRLLKIRQNLPKSERFRMVRVGRLEAMHEQAADVSSQRLAQRDTGRTHPDALHPLAGEEIARLEAKINMWREAMREAKNPERRAYCQTRISDMNNRLNLLRGKSTSSDRLIQAERRTIEGADIIVTTLSSSHSFKMKGLKGRIALCIVDEAGQAIEPETLIPLTLGVTRLTLVGDPQQLPGYICSQRAKDHGLGQSLFSRLALCSDQWAPAPTVLLDQQYRMHAAIAQYPSRAFYDGRVRSVPPPRAPLEGPPYLVLGIASGDRGQGASGANEMEAWGVARLAAALAQRTRALQLSLAVITPYAGHRDLLRDMLRDLSDARVEVNTVDSFQGQERDVVLVSVARSQGAGFLTDAGRMNVMLTRARHQLLVCLNPLAFTKNAQWQTFVEDARKRNLYKTVPKTFCQPIFSNAVSSDGILNYVFNQ